MNLHNKKSHDLDKYSQRNQGKKSITKKEKTLKIHKIQLIYSSKLKSNAIRRNIMKKTQNLTQNHTPNTPIHRRIKAFHFVFQKTKI